MRWPWRSSERQAGDGSLPFIPAAWLKPALFALGALVVIIFVVYTYVTIRAFRDDARRIVGVYTEAILPRVAADPNLTGAELGVLFDLIADMPVGLVITDRDGQPLLWRGISIPDSARSGAALAQVGRIAKAMDESTPPRDLVVPVEGGADFLLKVHVAESRFLRRVAWMPVVATCVTLIFTVIALWAFRQIKSGEQHALWAGMAKETAHQLGTPLSSMSGWIELLAEEIRPLEKGRRRADELVREMSQDLERLGRIAQRFGQVGSAPELHVASITPIVDETVTYFRTRMPQLGKDVSIERDYRTDIEVPLNGELLGWAFENLFKNSLDALRGVEDDPVIWVSTSRTDRWLLLLVVDNGKGIALQNLRRIFQPGYSTKKRGWGLGMTFVKRIIEDYHGGKISAFSDGPGKGTAIEIRLPISQ